MMLAFARAFHKLVPVLPPGIFSGLAVPFHLLSLAGPLRGLAIGAQDVSPYGDGAYTGEINASMLRDTGCDFCLVGHSERRQLLGESVADTAAKLERLLRAGVTPVFCIGETLSQRDAGALVDVLAEQLEPVNAVAARETLAVAYEPIWAIGTGVAARASDVAEAHGLIRNILPTREVPILYGGSVKPENAHELASIDEVGGFLIGGASLKAVDFAEILRGFAKAKRA